MWRIRFVRAERPSDLSDSLQCAPTLRRQQHDMSPDIWPNEWRGCTYTDPAFRCLKVESDSNRSSVWSQVRHRFKHVGLLQRLSNYYCYLSFIQLYKNWVLYCKMWCNAVCWIPWNGGSRLLWNYGTYSADYMVSFESSLTVHFPHEIMWNANLMQ